MYFYFRLLVFIFIFYLPCITTAKLVNDTEIIYQEIQWEELIPTSWNPEKIFEGINIDDYSDDDPRLENLLQLMTEEWNNAPANHEIAGQSIKIPGFVVPLDWDESGRLEEFLLVPYFGACIHVPPPPANQIIYIHSEQPLINIELMDIVWVYGELEIMSFESGTMGTSGYRMNATKVEIYQ